MSLWDELQNEKQLETQMKIENQNAVRNDVVEEIINAVCEAIRTSLKKARIADEYYVYGSVFDKKISRKHICSGFRIIFWNTDDKKFHYNLSEDVDYGNQWWIYNLTNKEKIKLAEGVIKYLQTNGLKYCKTKYLISGYSHSGFHSSKHTTYEIFDKFPEVQMTKMPVRRGVETEKIGEFKLYESEFTLKYILFAD